MSQPMTAEEHAADTLRVLIVDDHDLFRNGLRNLLEGEGVCPARLLVVTTIGAHPDARHPELARLWALEEEARAVVAAALG